MFDWHLLLSARFWFTPQPGPLLSVVARFLLIIFAVCLILATGFFIWSYFKRGDHITFKLLKKFQNFFTTLGIVGFAILFFFWQQIPYLSSRFWLIVWLLILLIWAGYIGRFAFFEAPKKRTELQEKAKFEKYLPKKRK
jgi:hypothetical protein